MGKRIKTLYIEDNNGLYNPVMFKAETYLKGIMGLDYEAPLPEHLKQFPTIVDMFKNYKDWYQNTSYIIDWKKAIVESPGLDVEVCNMNNLIQYKKCLDNIKDYELIVISHIAANNGLPELTMTSEWYRKRKGKLALYIGNEYDKLSQKTEAARLLRADCVCTQLPLEAGEYLYSDCDIPIIPMPHALNPELYHPPETEERKTDIGFVGAVYMPFIGDMERTSIINYFEEHGASTGLRCDIRKVSLLRHEWAEFLRSIKGIIGAESGTYYLNDKGRLLDAAKDYNLKNRDAAFNEVFEKFYKGKPEISGKAISSRHFEPIGTKTCQILIEGNYNGILKPDTHYISVKKDLSNINDAIRRFKDDRYRNEMVERAYKYVMAEHTYKNRVESLLNFIL